MTATPLTPSSTSSTETRIENHNFILFLRLAWILLLIFQSVAILQLLPANLNSTSVTEEIGSLLQEWGMLQAFSTLSVILLLLMTIIYYTISTILIWRSKNQRAAIFFSFVFLMTSSFGYISTKDFGIEWIERIRLILFNVGLVGILFYFPTASLSHKILIYPIVASIVVMSWSYLTIGTLEGIASFAPVTLSVLGVGSFILRFRMSPPKQKQQLKWLLIPFLGMLLIIVSWQLTYSFVPAPMSIYIILILLIAAFFELPILAAVFGFAILRYKMWEVDLVINRVFVYGAVTILLLVVGLGAIALVSAFFGSQGTLLGLAFGGGLAIGLFRPAQGFIQHQVDRRIYGLRYDLNEIAAAQKRPEIKNAGLYTGKHFGKFEALDQIGRGGMGEVYKGFADGETVAIKILPADLAQKPELWKRFERESQTLQDLQHPNIVHWRESGVSDGVAYLAMDFVDGEELGSVLQNGRVKDYASLMDWLKNIAAALDFAHEKGYVHRDLKPSNIMLRRGKDIELKEAVLMDFGVARTLATVTRLTGTGALGTIDYMAPEQILEAKEVDKRADVYALGVIVYELLTGERPFKGSAGQILFAHLQQPAPDPRDIQDDIPRHIAHAIEKALSKDPKERFQSAGEFVASLDSA
jgi:hypothetical protein